MAGAGKLVLAEAPFRHFRADLGGHGGVVRHEPQQPLLIGRVLAHDRGAIGIAAFGITIVHADIVEREGAEIVRVGLTVGDAVELAEIVAIAGVHVALEQYILARVITRGLGEGHAVRGHVGQAHAIGIGLDLVVGRAVARRAFGADPRHQPARWIAGHAIRVDVERELVVGGVRELDAVERLAIGRVALTPDGEADARSGHQVALIGRVDEDLSLETLPRLRAEGGDAIAVHLDPALRAVEWLIAHDGDARLLCPILEDALGDLRFELPHRIAVDKILGPGGTRGVGPDRRVVIISLHLAIEFERQAADRAMVAGVGPAEAVGRHAAEIVFAAHQQHRPAKAPRLDRGDNPARGAAINDDIGAWMRLGGRG